MPGFFAPMGASIAARLPKGKDWTFEVKWDGVRGLCYIRGGQLEIYTRNNNRCDRQYPELHVLPNFVDAREAVIDAEVVSLDPKGISRFELIQPRIHNQDAHAIAKMAEKSPVHLYCFDLLYVDGFDLRRVELSERKKLLAQVLQPGGLLHLSDSFDDGEALLAAAQQAGLEGLIAKCGTSCYESRRSKEWLKYKLTAQQEFLICGYSPGERDTFGSLVLGYYDDEGTLLYCGNVGTGFTEQILQDLLQRLKPLVTPKMPMEKADKVPRGSVWVEPKLVAQVKFLNWTNDGKLRAPVYLGLRNDKGPVEVRREEGVTFTNTKKLYYPEDGFTKGDLLAYYEAVAELLVPHLKDRPLSLKRYPNGIHSQFFFQKNTPESYPSWLLTEQIEDTRFVLAQDKRSLLYLVNLGCIDQNPWMSRVGSLSNPDYILFDIDPYQCAFTKVVEATLLVKEKLDRIGLTSYPKTTGGDGMHIFVPVEPLYTYDQVRLFAEVIAKLLAAERPDLFTTPRSIRSREPDRVYFDYLQIAESKTISSVYSARAYAGAPVSTPLEWDEVTPKLHPAHFNIKNAPERFARRGDLFADVLEKPQRLEKAFARLDKLVRRT